MALNAGSSSAAEQVRKDEKNSTGPFLGHFQGAGDGILTTLPLRSHLHRGSSPQKHGAKKFKGLTHIILYAFNLLAGAAWSGASGHIQVHIKHLQETQPLPMPEA